MNEKNKSNNLELLSDRITNFETGLNEKKQNRKQVQLPVSGMALAARVATELLAGIVVGTFLGWLIDGWLETTPIFMLVLFFLGAAAGIANLWRLFTGRGMSIGYFKEAQSKKKQGLNDIELKEN